MPSIKLSRGKPVIKSLTVRIAEHLDVVGDALLGVASGCITPALDAFALKKLEKAPSDGIVVVVSTPADAWFQRMLRQETGPVLAGELQALIHLGARLDKDYIV